MENTEVDKVYDNEYFRINKILNLSTGLWPYRTGMLRILQRFIVTCVLGGVTVPHINGVRVWCGRQLGLCSENIAGVVYAAGVFSKYLVTIWSESKISNVYKQVAENWIAITDPDEREIMLKYARLGKLKSYGYVGYLTLAALCFSQLGMLPVLLDFIVPLNESRQKLLPVQAEFFVDPWEYYYHIYFIYCVLTVVSVLVLMSIDTTYTAVVHQNLGIFNVIKYRLQKATKLNNKCKDTSYDVLISAISLHQESLQFIDSIESTYDTCFLILIIISVLFLTFGAITIMERSDSALDFVRLSMIEFGVMIHLFYLSWPGQLVMTESFDIFIYTYLNEWYALSERSKTLLKIMMVRTMKPCCLTAAGLYVMNFENYGSIIKTTMSYITVLASFRN